MTEADLLLVHWQNRLTDVDKAKEVARIEVEKLLAKLSLEVQLPLWESRDD